MSEWKRGESAPRDGSEILAAWRGDNGPRIIRRAWVDQSGFAVPAPDFWQPIVIPAVIRAVPPPKKPNA